MPTDIIDDMMSVNIIEGVARLQIPHIIIALDV
jgi:hypothetical protein